MLCLFLSYVKSGFIWNSSFLHIVCFFGKIDCYLIIIIFLLFYVTKYEINFEGRQMNKSKWLVIVLWEITSTYHNVLYYESRQ